MTEEEFKAPDWVSNEDQNQPTTISKKQKTWLFITLAIVIPFCLWAGWFEFGRAQEGRWRAWVYTFEWPFFAGVAIYMSRRILRGDIPRIPKPSHNDESDQR